MFGQGSVTSTWGQPQQNQQQPQQQQQQQGAPTFGQPASSFGTSGGFGSGAGAFGQQQQPQQQANPMFGGLGGTSTSATPSTGFGAFGSTPAANTGSSLFGAPKPTTGFGAFGGGGTSTFGGTGATGTGTFGSTTTGTSGGIFGGGGGGGGGGNTTTGTGFGSNFGAKPVAGFGTATSTNPNAGPYDGVAPVSTGSSNPPYSAFNEKDTANPSVTLQYQSISSMPAYRGTSFEIPQQQELRFQDYQQGRKTAGAFGQTSFGQPAAQTTTSIFGQPSTSAQPATTSIFGQPANTGTTGTFGSTATSGTATGGFGTFGQPAQTPATTGGGLFGGFGQQSQQQPQQQQQQPTQQGTSGFGAFGQTQATPSTGGGLFGGFGAANQNQQKPTFGGFSTGGTSTSTFNYSAPGTFGQPQQQAGTTNLFGQPAQQQNTTTTGFGTFGQPNANQAKPSMFGAPATTTTATTGFGTFGQPQQQTQQSQQPGQTGTSLFGGGGLFGQQSQQQGQQGQTTSLFGQPAQQQQSGTTSLFGGGTNTTGTAGTGGLFGNLGQQQQQQPNQPAQTSSFGLFGQPKPATTTSATGGSLFGGFGQQNAGAGTGTQSTGLFGQPTGQQSTNQTGTTGFGGNLFGRPTGTGLGTTPSAQPATGFGGSNPFASTLGTSALGAMTTQQPTLTASIAQPIGTNLPIFSVLPPGPRAISLDSQPKKKSLLFQDIPTRSPVPRLQLGYTPASSKLRGFSSTSTPPIPGAHGQTLGSSVSLTNGKPNALSLSKAGHKSLLAPDSFLSVGSVGSSPSLGSGGRQSVKKLILDRKVEPSDLFKSAAAEGRGRITFNPQLSVAAREAEAAATGANALSRADNTAGGASKNKAPQGRFSAQSTHEPTTVGTENADGRTLEPQLQEGDYYVKPPLEELRKMGYEDLLAFPNLVVGRIGYGEIQFLEPVDLTGLSKLGALLGELIRFDDKECMVYPDTDDTDKPSAGSGLNVKARIVLVKCWAENRATREPITDERDPVHLKHVKRLKNMKGTKFEGFEIEEGKWTFTVDHF